MRKIEIELENLRHRLSKGGDNFLLFYLLLSKRILENEKTKNKSPFIISVLNIASSRQDESKSM